METQGILFVASGKKYIQSAMRAARTVRKFCPGLPVHLFGDWPVYGFPFDRLANPFTSAGVIENPHVRSKVDYIACTPFDRTLYLDTDTALNADVRDMFRVLDRFDIALNHAFWRNHPSRIQSWRIDLPRAFPQFNSGVILYRRSPATLRLFEDWRAAYEEAGAMEDQLTLRELLWSSDVRIATLPPEYNVRFMKYHFMWSKTEAKTQIFHLRRYHDGPFWPVKAWARRQARGLLRFGTDLRARARMKK